MKDKISLHKIKIFLLCCLSLWMIGSCSSNSSPSLLFFSFGDWGSGTSDQKAVATAVKDFCQTERCNFGLLLGDNFYPSGVGSVDDPQWQEKFEQVYTGLDLPFYAVLGNHDHQGNIQAEIDYTLQQDRWKMPARHYKISYPENSTSPLLEIFAFDSGPSDGSGEIPQDPSFQELMAQLQSSQARWKILAMHHPIYSNGQHGDSAALVDLIPQICNQVDVVLSGHDHIFSQLDDAQDGCAFQQWVVGTGGQSLYTIQPDSRSVFSEAAFGFAAVRINQNKLEIAFYHVDGSIADTYTIEK